MKCKECTLFATIQNTDQTGHGLCTFCDSYEITQEENDCPYLTKKPPTCGDCHRFKTDHACLTCQSTDSAIIAGQLCGGFIDADEVTVENILAKWMLQEGSFDARLQKIKESILQMKVPKQKE